MTLRLTLVYDQYEPGTPGRRSLEVALLDDLATILDVPPARFAFVNAFRGSVLATVDVLPATSNVTEPSPTFLSLRLQGLFEAAAAGRFTLDGAFLRYADPTYLQIVVLEPCSDGSYIALASGQVCPIDDSEFTEASTIAVGAFIGFVVFLGALSAIFYKGARTHVFTMGQISLAIVDFATDVILLRSYALAGYTTPLIAGAACLLVSMVINCSVMYWRHLHVYVNTDSKQVDVNYAMFKQQHQLFFVGVCVLSLSNVGVLRLVATNLFGLKWFSLEYSMGRIKMMNHIKRISFWSSLFEDVPQMAVQLWVVFFEEGGPTSATWLSASITVTNLLFSLMGALLATLGSDALGSGFVRSGSIASRPGRTGSGRTKSRRAWGGSDTSATSESKATPGSGAATPAPDDTRGAAPVSVQMTVGPDGAHSSGGGPRRAASGTSVARNGSQKSVASAVSQADSDRLSLVSMTQGGDTSYYSTGAPIPNAMGREDTTASADERRGSGARSPVALEPLGDRASMSRGAPLRRGSAASEQHDGGGGGMPDPGALALAGDLSYTSVTSVASAASGTGGAGGGASAGFGPASGSGTPGAAHIEVFEPTGLPSQRIGGTLKDINKSDLSVNSFVSTRSEDHEKRAAEGAIHL